MRRAGSDRRAISFAMRSSAARFLVPIALVIAIVQSFQQGWSAGEWDDSLRMAANHSLAIDLAVSAAAAFDAFRFCGRYPGVGVSVRQLRAPLVGLAGSTVWGVAAVGFLSLMAMAGTGAVSPWRMPHVGLTFVAAAFTIEVGALGWLLGTVLPFFISIPLLVLSVWVGNAFLATATGHYPALLSGLDDGVFPAGLAPMEPVLVGQILVFVGIASALFGVSQLRNWSGHLRLGTAIVCAVMLVVGTTLMVTYGPARSSIVHAAKGPRVCVTQHIPVCTWPDHARAGILATRIANPMWTSLTAAGAQAPLGLVDTGLSAPDGWAHASMWNTEPADLVVAVAEATLVWEWCPRLDTTQTLADWPQPISDRLTWLEARVLDTDPSAYSPSARAILTESKAQQARWVLHKPSGITCIVQE